MSTSELSLESARGSRLSELYIEHHDWLKHWLCKKLGCSYQAADVAHDTFVQVLTSRCRVAEIVEPRAYLTTLAQRLLFNFWRRRDLEQAYLQSLRGTPEQFAPSLEDRALLLETLNLIDEALQSVSRQARAVFVLSQLHELTYREIAARLDMPPITVRRHMQRAIRACYRQLEPLSGDASSNA